MWSVPDVKHVSGTYLHITGGSGEIRTRDQRIKSPHKRIFPNVDKYL